MGSLFGGGGGGGSTQTIQKADPWEGIQPYLRQAATDTQGLYDSGKLKPEFFPGSTVVPFSPETNAALNLTTNRALTGSPLNAAANEQLQGTLRGDYLSPTTNPGFKQGLQDITDAYSKGTAAQTDAAFNRSGAYGGSAYREMTGDNSRKFADSLNKYAGDLYSQERENQIKATALAPQQASQDYTDYAQLANVGAAREGLDTAKLQEQVDRFNAQQAAPQANIQNYIDLLNGASQSVGQSSTTSNPYYQNNLASTIGGIGSLFSSGIPQFLGSAATTPAFNASAYILGGLPWSDIRLKHDITKVGYENGFPVYTFRYNENIDPNQLLRRGVMAQDVLKTRPDAVGQTEDGIMYVDYAKIGITPAIVQ